MYSLWRTFVNINYKLHLLFSLMLRLGLIIYSIHHDRASEVKYTDIDYKVFTDASRYVLHGMSPYNRHTFRYSPLIAIFLIPNVILHHSFGKILFCFGDIIVAVLIRLIVRNMVNEYERYKHSDGKKIKNEWNMDSKKALNIRHRKKNKYLRKQQDPNFAIAKSVANSNLEVIVNISMLLWLYNPLTLTISTRGNCDSLATLFVLLTLYNLQCRHRYFITGLVHGISIHFRLYPIIYSLAFYMFLSKFSVYEIRDRRKYNDSKELENVSNQKQLKNIENSIVQSSWKNYKVMSYKDINKRRTIFKKEYLLYIVPNLDQIKLITGCILSLSSLTYIFYTLYGYIFLYETYVYHFIRKDTRHNFSLYFYLQYLTAWVKNIGVWQKVLVVLPQIVLILVFSIRYGLNKFSLNFSILTQTIVMVIYNGVLTSQYFVWVMALLPLCIWQIKIPQNMTIFLLTIWFAAQCAWLLPAYLLEFKGQNTFIFIWIQGVSFFCVNIAILGRLIMYFMPPREKTV